MKHPCKAPNCKAQISERYLMCPRHWAAVPHGIQLQVHRAWRALNQGRNPNAIDSYRAAVQQAIDSVTKPEVILGEMEQRYMRERMESSPRNKDGTAKLHSLPSVLSVAPNSVPSV